MNSIWIFVGFIGLYFSLQLWILPACGIPTWMSGRNSPGENKSKSVEVSGAPEVTKAPENVAQPSISQALQPEVIDQTVDVVEEGGVIGASDPLESAEIDELIDSD